ncbi:Gag-Pol polyprotein [Bienertia sinuspersici]
MAMHIKKGDLVCNNCGKSGHSTERCWACKAYGKNGHTADKCWTMVGYPARNNKAKTEYKEKNKESGKASKKWNRGKQKLAANAQCEGVQNAKITAEQLEHGRVELKNGLKLNNVMYVPSFRHNLLSAQKLAQDSGCKLVFHSNYCIIQDENSSVVRGIGKADKGVYCLVNEPVAVTIQSLKSALVSKRRESEGICAAASS